MAHGHPLTAAGGTVRRAAPVAAAARRATRAALFRGLLACGLLAGGVVAGGAAPLPSPVELVDPFVGTAGRGNTVPGPALPHASIHPGPQTLGDKPSGYDHREPVVGFAQLHAQGTGGRPSYGNFLVTPRRGLEIREAEHASPKTGETATVAAYAVRLARFDILAEVAPAAHSALYRFTFPEADDAHIVIDVARKAGGVVGLQSGSVRVDPGTGLVTGGGRFAHDWNPAPYDLYFAARVSVAPAAVGTWAGAEIRAGAVEAATAREQPLGAFLRYRTRRGQQVLLKIAVSFTSAERARRYLDEEIPAWDFAGVRERAAAAWAGRLGRVSLEGAPREQAGLIYTALWHAQIQPRDRTGDVPGFDPALPLWDDQYTLWDTWRTLFPLLALVDPATVRDNVLSFLNRHRAAPDGFVATAFTHGREFRTGQGGDDVDNVIADAFARGVPGVPWDEAYALLRHDAERGRTAHYRDGGWAASDEPTGFDHRYRSGSATLAFAVNDYAVATVARGLGRTADAARYLARSGSWRNVWDASLESGGFRGFPRARSVAGAFSATPALGNRRSDFYEGTPWEYSFAVPHDVPGLVERTGGREAFVRRLLHALRRGRIDFGNEPSFQTPWLFARVGRPYLTSFWADRYLARFRGRALPGDDDSGAMSSLYFFLVAGIFPVAGQDLYVLHGARVPKLVLRLEGGRELTIVGENAGPGNRYVQSASFAGRPLAEPLITHTELARGGTLRFVMGPEPSAWGVVGDFDPKAAALEVLPPEPRPGRKGRRKR